MSNTDDTPPTTEYVRHFYASGRWADGVGQSDTEPEFDRWLAGVKADAWDEGFEAVPSVTDWHRNTIKKSNPYRVQP